MQYGGNMKKIWIIAAGFLILVSGCARFRVSDLSKSTVISLPITEENLHGVYFPSDNGVLQMIPGRVGIKDNLIIFPEPYRNQIKIFKDRKLLMILKSNRAPDADSAQKLEEKKKALISAQVEIKKSDVLNVPGKIVIGEQDDFYVENYDPIKNADEGSGRFGFYRILHFDLNGNFKGIIGRKGQSELPFDNIMWMDTDKEGALWVFYRQLDELNLDMYSEGNMVFSMTENKCFSQLYGEHQEKNLQNVCEYMYPFPDGSRILLVGRSEKEPEKDSNEKGYLFQYRTFKYYDIESRKAETIFEKMNDPDDFPFLPYDDNNILIWQTRSPNTIRFAVYSTGGSLKNNLEIEFDGFIHSWRRTYYTLKGNFYSIRTFKDSIKIYEWN